MKVCNKILCIFFSALLIIGGCSADGADTGVSGQSVDEQAENTELISSGESESEPEAIPVMKPISAGDDMPVLRGMAVKMLALIYEDKRDMEIMDREITYIDSNAEYWYDKYINAAKVRGIIQTAEEYFYPENPLTISQAQQLILNVNPQSAIKMQITDENRDKAISYALWCSLYKELLNELSKGQNITEDFGITEESVIVLADISNNTNLPEGHIISDKGQYSCEGMDFSKYIDKEISILSKNNEILAVLNVENNTPLIRGAYVVSHADNKLKVFIGGAERTYNLNSEFVFDTGAICDFIINNGTAEDIKVSAESFTDTVKLIRSEYAEVENTGIIPLDGNFKVYDISEGSNKAKLKSLHDVIPGQTMRFIRDNGTIRAALIENKQTADTIRVVIKDTGFNNFAHKSVVLSGEQEITAFEKISGSTHTYQPGEKIIFENPLDFPERVYISSPGKIAVESIDRGYGIPEYRGILEIAVQNGQFLIVNELSIEEYLYSVVPSEMPTSYGIEPMKVQAVTARSYAYNQYFANNFYEYGANVCDSVISQVYNNVEENGTSIQAVNQTEGLCLTYGGEVISANFFSTSPGVTANNGEVWADGETGEFPTSSSPYLMGKNHYQQADYGDLSIEENLAAFIKADDIKAYDNFSPWFRWHVEMSNEQISASVNANLKARYEANPRLVKTLQADGVFRSRPVENIGQLVNIEVIDRGHSGNIMTMKITGTENTVLISTEYNVRMLIRPKNYIDGGSPVVLQLNGGSVMEDYDIMPSAFYAMERMTDIGGRILYVKFYGGGNGHGVGMSQTGVKGMVDAGFSFDEILKNYYTGTEVEKLK
ncbi:MAG: SpoIID/LytB domain-containing protein [Clostridiales bacterium]|nr:SpoIID/LytB domain-containing protein [Clostridiales bacterium]